MGQTNFFPGARLVRLHVGAVDVQTSVIEPPGMALSDTVLSDTPEGPITHRSSYAAGKARSLKNRAAYAHHDTRRFVLELSFINSGYPGHLKQKKRGVLRIAKAQSKTKLDFR